MRPLGLSTVGPMPVREGKTSVLSHTSPGLEETRCPSLAPQVVKAFAGLKERIEARRAAAMSLDSAPDRRSTVWSLGPPVGNSKDLTRILALPRRDPKPVDMTARFARSGCTRPLRPVQSLALAEAEAAGGLIGAIGVGEGKTLITLLLPIVLGSKKAVLLVPPQLKDRLITNDWPEWHKHYWLPNLLSGSAFRKGAPNVEVVAYSELSSARRFDILERAKPDLVIADEAHCLRHKDTARTRRFLHYMRQHPETRFCALSGTLTTRSLHDYAHLCALALGEGSPLPLEWHTLEEWSTALDVTDMPADPGALNKLCAPGEDARAGFARRFLQTPGVVSTDGKHEANELVISLRPLALDAATTDALAHLRTEWETPSGEQLNDALSLNRVARQLACGVFTRWIYPRNEPLPLRKKWLAARSDWNREVFEFLKHRHRLGIDSPLLVEEAVLDGRVHSEAYEPWAEVRDLVKPETEAVWVSDFMVRDAVAWGQERPGIIWYSTVAVGQRIAEEGGFPFYGDGEGDSDRLEREEDGRRTVVASIPAQGTGLNLQALSRNLILSFPSNGVTAEQLFGRTHRSGQPEPQVSVEVYLHTAEGVAAFEQAREDALYIEKTRRAPQRLLYGTYTFDPKRLS